MSCVIDGDDGFSILSLAEFLAAKPAAGRAAARAAAKCSSLLLTGAPLAPALLFGANSAGSPSHQ